MTLDKKAPQFEEIIQRSSKEELPRIDVTAAVLHRIRRDSEGFDMGSMALFACCSLAIAVPCLPYIYFTYLTVAHPLSSVFQMAGGIL